MGGGGEVSRPTFDPTLAGPVPVDAAVDCQEAVRELYTYLDGELTEERRVEIKVHLDLCQPCAGAAGFEVELRQVIAQRCRDHVPDSLIERVAAAIKEERQAHGEPV
jgi:mycothiol system anti-sigma-R factor